MCTDLLVRDGEQILQEALASNRGTARQRDPDSTAVLIRVLPTL